jgi:hypothetical protein
MSAPETPSNSNPRAQAPREPDPAANAPAQPAMPDAPPGVVGIYAINLRRSSRADG